MDSNILFCMRGATAKDDAGLNVIFTGQKLHSVMKLLVKTRKINRRKCHTLLKLLLWPWGAVWQHWMRRKADLASGLPILLFWLRRHTGQSPIWVLYALMSMWIALTWLAIGSGILKLSPLHHMEVVIALLYYIWAGIDLAIEVSSEVSNVPGDVTFRLAFQKANLCLASASLTRLEDGQQCKVTAMGLLQMSSWLHERDEEDEEDDEDDEDDEESDPFQIGRSTLDMLWKQKRLKSSVPFIDDMTTVPANVIHEYEVHGKINSAVDWEERSLLYFQSMMTKIDVGEPTLAATCMLLFLAGLNASIGVINRVANGQPTIGSSTADVSLVLCCGIITFVCSYTVFRELFCTAFRWYTVLTFMTQLAQVLSIEGAMRLHLPCYIDLRHEGNLEAWYLARSFLNEYCNCYVFGTRAQTIVASSLVVSTLISFNALANYFADSTNIDWSDPGGWFSLLNMIVLAALLFLALVALERFNADTKKLVKVLDAVSIEVSRTSTATNTARERLKDDKERLKDDSELDLDAKTDEADTVVVAAVSKEGSGKRSGDSDTMAAVDGLTREIKQMKADANESSAHMAGELHTININVHHFFPPLLPYLFWTE
eukprot:COSAG01_NODE_226_length_21147_cov_59.226435_22_plen_600_part_00